MTFMFNNILAVLLAGGLLIACGPRPSSIYSTQDVAMVEHTNAVLLRFNAEDNRYEIWLCARLKLVSTFADCQDGGKKRGVYKDSKFFDTLITLLKENQQDIVKDNHRAWVQTAADAILKEEMDYIISEQARYKKEIAQIEEFVDFYSDQASEEVLSEKKKRMRKLKEVNDRFAELNLYYKALTGLVEDFIVLVQNKETVFYKEVMAEQIYSLLLSKLIVGGGDGGVNDLEMGFIDIPAGTFEMGSPSSEQGRQHDEGPLHTVTISKAFEMQITEVTQSQWFSVMGDNPSEFNEPTHCPNIYQEVEGTSLCPNYPVEQVSWDDAQLFIEQLNDQNDGYHYRLPTEAEWEYAARAGTTGPYSVDGPLESSAWYNENSRMQTHAVGQLKANDFGLYDMHGNVWEWVSDWYGAYPTSHVTDPTGDATGNGRVLRGGCWFNDAEFVRVAHRKFNESESRNSAHGLRLLRVRK